MNANFRKSSINWNAVEENRASEIAFNMSASVGSGLPAASFGNQPDFSLSHRVDNPNISKNFFSGEMRAKQPSIAMQRNNGQIGQIDPFFADWDMGTITPHIPI